ncbi:hypothetical protein DKX38_013348 [Salix brachista]|uniref:Uncharacterized protein n=1 Tax=Salix brachista TaxID=2182728 RepID=A0A5N5LSW4_9ROSI|nr:hypothetical protein DKX38_013348 [Salix brachista]
MKMGYKCASQIDWRYKPSTRMSPAAKQHRAKHLRGGTTDQHQDSTSEHRMYGEVVEHERNQVCVKVGHHVVCNENVDEVAAEFIKLKHKRTKALVNSKQRSYTLTVMEKIQEK